MGSSSASSGWAPAWPRGCGGEGVERAARPEASVGAFAPPRHRSLAAELLREGLEGADGGSSPGAPAQMSVLLDRFIPRPDVRERHATLVRAPAGLVLEVAREFDLQEIPIVHAIFWLRAKLLRAKTPPPARGMGLVALTQRIGWGVLVDQPGAYVSGAACRPWQADVVFSGIPVEQFVAYAEPDQVKIVWSLETEALEPTLTRLATETRVVATDEHARAKFRRYWRVFGIGIVLIRWLVLPAVRRRAERQWRARRGGG
jgi:hypothetical protein